jgi:hypothetical protein
MATSGCQVLLYNSFSAFVHSNQQCAAAGTALLSQALKRLPVGLLLVVSLRDHHPGSLFQKALAGELLKLRQRSSVWRR